MTDVLILGGGLAGAAAALWLADHGRSATIIEARPRLGGRALSRDWDGEVVEYGGGWLRQDHGLMRALAHRLGIVLVSRAPLVTPFPATPARFRTDAAAIATDPVLQAMTLADYLRERALPDEADEILSWWTISGSGDPARIALSELMTPKLARGFGVKLEELAFTLQGGMGGLVQAAANASGAGLILGDPVERVAQGGALVTATLASGRRVQGRAALVALPINCLGQVRFDPPLNPAQQALRRQGHLGRALKLLIRARGVAPGSLSTRHSHGLRWFWADHAMLDGSTLVVAFGLADAVGEPDPALVAQALDHAFPGALLVDMDWHDWCTDPFALGTWVSPEQALLAHYAPENWAPQGRLAFAGSDLYSPEQGWFEGALITARAAADALHDQLTKAPAHDKDR